MVNEQMMTARFGARALAVISGLTLGALTLIGCASATGESADSVSTNDSWLSGSLTIYAAASLHPALDTLTQKFAETHPGVDIAPTVYDGSSTLAAQLVSGAPADLFASADASSMQTVMGEGLIAGSAPVFATNVLVIAVPPGNPLDIASLADLAEPVGGEAPVVVLCATEVPCGSAATTLLEQARVDLAPASEEQNVSAVLAKVQAGEADAGLVYRTDVMASRGRVDSIDIDGAAEHSNRYPIGVLDGSGNRAAAEGFSEFVRSTDGQAVLTKHGFGAP